MLLLIAAASLAVATIGSLAAVALVAHSPTKLSRLVEGDPRWERLGRDLQDHGDDYQVLARLLSIGGVVGAVVLVWNGSDGLRGVALGAWTALTVLLCGVLPVSLSKTRAERVVLTTTRILRPVLFALRYPFVVPLQVLGRSVLRALRVSETPPTDPEEIVGEITAAVGDTAQDGMLQEEERHWIENIVELKDQNASEVMTPRTDMVAFSSDMPLIDAVREASRAGFSRFPVYEEKVDNVIGVFYAKDVLPLLGNGREELSQRVGERMRKPLFVPESMSLVELLRQFRASKVQMAVVLDEYGGTAGVVSIEDVLEEIVGDISDEYDAEDDEPIRVIEEGRVIEITGRARVDEANEILGSQLPEDDDYDTVAGYVFSTLDRIPKVNETLPSNGVEIRILRADDRRISRMRLTVIPEESGASR